MYFSYYFLIRDDFLSWVGTWDLTIGGWGWDWSWGGLPLLFGSGPRGDLDLAQYEAVAFELEAVAVAVGLYDSNRLGNSSSVWCSYSCLERACKAFFYALFCCYFQ